jgi:hypothetical protein
MKWIEGIIGWIRSVLFPQPPEHEERVVAQSKPDFQYECVEDVPETPTAGTLYVAGEGPHRWAALMLCPCGCGDSIQLNLLAKARPSWDIEEHSDDTISIYPSVWRTKGCRSHFFVRHGRVDWCVTEPSSRSGVRKDFKVKSR